MNHLEDVQEVSFVTNGIGGGLFREILSFYSPRGAKNGEALE